MTAVPRPAPWPTTARSPARSSTSRWASESASTSRTTSTPRTPGSTGTASSWPNKSDGTPLTQNLVPPGGSYLYDFVVTRPGVYWYHPHHQYSTNQVVRGLYGSLIVDDPNEAPLQANGTLPSPADTHTLMVSDLTVCKAPGQNDTVNYDPSLPHVSGGPLPAQGAPHPDDLCDTPFDQDGNPTNTPLARGMDRERHTPECGDRERRADRHHQRHERRWPSRHPGRAGCARRRTRTSSTSARSRDSAPAHRADADPLPPVPPDAQRRDAGPARPRRRRRWAA